jgi:hypothetical protein
LDGSRSACKVQRLQPLVDNFEFLKPYSEGISVTIVVTLIAYLSFASAGGNQTSMVNADNKLREFANNSK